MLSTNLELILAYFNKLEDEKFFGTVEITLQGGKFAYSRELRSKQDFEIAAEAWDSLTDSAKQALIEKFEKSSKFHDLMRENESSRCQSPKKTSR